MQKLFTLNSVSETSNSERFGEKESVWYRKSRPKTQIFFSKWELIWLIIQESYKLLYKRKSKSDQAIR